MKQQNRWGMALAALRASFPSTIPVMAGYVFIGITYGILMRTSGYPAWLPTVTALVIYTGSMEFLMVGILASAFNPLSAAVTALMVGSRHLFYGLSLLGKYRNMGWKKFYLIYTTSDETFAVNYAAEIPDGIDPGWYYLWVSFLDQMYWTLGTTIGSLGAGWIRFNTDGLSFVMTAMFLVILMSQWVKDGTTWSHFIPDHASELIGIGCSVLCLVLFGPDNFIIPTMAAMLLCFTILRRPLEAYVDKKQEAVLENTGAPEPGEMAAPAGGENTERKASR